MTNEERRDAQRAQYLKMPRAKLAELLLDRDEALDRAHDRVGDLASEARKATEAAKVAANDAAQRLSELERRLGAMKRDLAISRTREAVTFGRLVELRGAQPTTRAALDPGSLDREAYAYLDRLFDRPSSARDGFSYGDERTWDHRR